MTTGFQYYPGKVESNFVTRRNASTFAPKQTDDDEEDIGEQSKKRTYDVCTEVDEELKKEGKERKRRLVSLYEANEVAKRLAGAKRGRHGVFNGYLVDNIETDVVSEWRENL